MLLSLAIFVELAFTGYLCCVLLLIADLLPIRCLCFIYLVIEKRGDHNRGAMVGGTPGRRGDRTGSSEAASPIPSAPFADGTRVQLHSLVSAAQLNSLQVDEQHRVANYAWIQTGTLTSHHHLTRPPHTGRA